MAARQDVGKPSTFKMVWLLCLRTRHLLGASPLRELDEPLNEEHAEEHLQAIRGLGLLNEMWLDASNCVTQCYTWTDRACTRFSNGNVAIVSSTLGLDVLVQHVKMHRCAQRQV